MRSATDCEYVNSTAFGAYGTLKSGRLSGAIPPLRVRHIHREEPAGESALARAHQVDMPIFHAAEEIKIAQAFVLNEAQKRVVMSVEYGILSHNLSPKLDWRKTGKLNAAQAKGVEADCDGILA